LSNLYGAADANNGLSSRLYKAFYGRDVSDQYAEEEYLLWKEEQEFLAKANG
jgi:hypothetical protein